MIIRHDAIVCCANIAAIDAGTGCRSACIVAMADYAPSFRCHAAAIFIIEGFRLILLTHCPSIFAAATIDISADDVDYVSLITPPFLFFFFIVIISHGHLFHAAAASSPRRFLPLMMMLLPPPCRYAISPSLKATLMLARYAVTLLRCCRYMFSPLLITLLLRAATLRAFALPIRHHAVPLLAATLLPLPRCCRFRAAADLLFAMPLYAMPPPPYAAVPPPYDGDAHAMP